MIRLGHPASLLFVLIISTGVLPDSQQDSSSNLGTASDSFSLLAVNPLSPPARLKVYRGQWTPVLRQHLPITKRVLRGGRHVCRIETEELAPIFSVVGHLEPKVGGTLIFLLFRLHHIYWCTAFND